MTSAAYSSEVELLQSTDVAKLRSSLPTGLLCLRIGSNKQETKLLCYSRAFKERSYYRY
jgi:hypothetical protein